MSHQLAINKELPKSMTAAGVVNPTPLSATNGSLFYHVPKQALLHRNSASSGALYDSSCAQGHNKRHTLQ